MILNHKYDLEVFEVNQALKDQYLLLLSIKFIKFINNKITFVSISLSKIRYKLVIVHLSISEKFGF
jgi:hypothetical protein